jgi:hypothetical protein
MMVNPLARADNELTVNATLSGLIANKENILPIMRKSGAPGGCPISSLYAHVINSPQSHQLTVGSIVKKYTIEAILKLNQPNKILQRL